VGSIHPDLAGGNSSPESIRQRLESLRTKRQELIYKDDETLFNREDPSFEQSRRLLHHEIYGIDGEIEQREMDLGRAETRRAVEKAHRDERLGSVARHAFLFLGSILLVGLAYLFRDSSLAAIPLLGLVALLILWPAFEKFRTLQRVSADFNTPGINVIAAATDTDEFLRMQGELAKKKVELEMAKIDRQIDQARHDPPTELRESGNPQELFRLPAPEETPSGGSES
jgi:hypothetical protein